MPITGTTTKHRKGDLSSAPEEKGPPSKYQKVDSKHVAAVQAAALNQVIAFNDETMINQDQFYHLLVGFDLLYSGLMAPGSIDKSADQDQGCFECNPNGALSHFFT